MLFVHIWEFNSYFISIVLVQFNSMCFFCVSVCSIKQKRKQNRREKSSEHLNEMEQKRKKNENVNRKLGTR